MERPRKERLQRTTDESYNLNRYVQKNKNTKQCGHTPNLQCGQTPELNLQQIVRASTCETCVFWRRGLSASSFPKRDRNTHAWCNNERKPQKSPRPATGRHDPQGGSQRARLERSAINFFLRDTYLAISPLASVTVHHTVNTN